MSSKQRLRIAALVLFASGCGGTGSSTPVTPAPEIETVGPSADALIDNAVASESRPADDRARDEARRPAEVLKFFGVKPGMVVADLITGGGYYADILSRVVGASGKVYAHNNKLVTGFAGEALSKRLSSPELADLANIETLRSELSGLGVPSASLDGALLVLFYHDLIWTQEDRAAVGREIFTALKPGGFFGVVDHVANADAGDVSKSLHRIDPNIIKTELAKAGFVLEAESDVLRTPDDDHTQNVFDETIRGKTDRVIYRFRKPAKK